MPKNYLQQLLQLGISCYCAILAVLIVGAGLQGLNFLSLIVGSAGFAAASVGIVTTTVRIALSIYDQHVGKR